MKRLAASAALAAVTVLALPAAPAYACSLPTGFFDLERSPVVAGATVRVSGDNVTEADGSHPPCMPPMPPMPPSPTPSETASATPAPDVTVSGEPEMTPSTTGPVVTLPPLVPVAYAAPPTVDLAIEPWHEYDEPPGTAHSLGSIVANPTRRWGDPAEGLYQHSFAGRVTIPAGLAPGEYMVTAGERGGVGYGYIRVDVVAGLAETGTATTDLLRLAALALVTGAGALVVARRV